MLNTEDLSNLHRRYDGRIPHRKLRKALYGTNIKIQTREQLETIIKNNIETALSHVKAILDFRKTRRYFNVLQLGHAIRRVRRRRALLLHCLQSNREIKLRLAALESQSTQLAAE